MHNDYPVPEDASAENPHPRMGYDIEDDYGTTSDNVGTGHQWVPDFKVDDMIDTAHKLQPFKLHAMAAIFTSFASFVIWLFVDFFAQHWPWWIYIFAAFALSLTFHFYYIIKNQEVLTLHFAWFVIINLMLLITWTIDVSESNGEIRDVWFLYPFFIMLGILGTHVLVVNFFGQQLFSFYVHVNWFVCLNGFFFSLWITHPHGEIWFIYPFYVLGLFLGIHYHILHYMGDWFRLHLFFFIHLNLFFFFIYISQDVTREIPWFAFVLVAWGVLFGVHYWLTKDSRKAAASSQHQNEHDLPQDYTTENVDDVTVVTPGQPSHFDAPEPLDDDLQDA